MRGDQLARQWRIIRSIEASTNGLTVAEVAQREETGIQTIYRDLEALQAAGFPRYTERVERGNRWAFIDTFNFKIPPLVSGKAAKTANKNVWKFSTPHMAFFVSIFRSKYSEEALRPLRPLRLCVKPEKQNVKPDPNPRNAEGKSICNKLFWSGRKEVEKGPVIGNAKN